MFVVGLPYYLMQYGGTLELVAAILVEVSSQQHIFMVSYTFEAAEPTLVVAAKQTSSPVLTGRTTLITE